MLHKGFVTRVPVVGRREERNVTKSRQCGADQLGNLFSKLGITGLNPPVGR